MKTKFFILVSILFLHAAVKAQMKIGDNSTSINNASLLELESTNKGLVLPRVPLSSVTSSLPLPTGLLTGTVVYNTSSSATGGSGAGIYVWDGAKWVFLSTSNSVISSAWTVNGNSGTTAANFLGTIDNISMRFRTNNLQRMIIDSVGRIGIGTNTPTEKLDVSGNLRFSGALMPNNNAGTVGYFLVSSGANNPPTWFDASNYAWQLDGNPVTAIRKFGTQSNYDLPFITNNIERMRLTSGGFLGIGTTNPGYTLSVLAASNPLYLSGVQASSTITSDSILTIAGGVVKKVAYSAFTGSTTNTLSLGGNTLTSTVNGVAATSAAVSGVGNTSSTNTLSTTVNGITGSAVQIINSNTNAFTQTGGLVNTVNGVAATTAISSGAAGNVIGFNSSGNPVYQSVSTLLNGATTNTLDLNGNIFTSTVNGITDTSKSVATVSNTSTANTLNTTVNGIAGTTVPIINSNANALTQGGGLITTVNGVAATTSIANGTITNFLGYNAAGNPVYQPLSNTNLSTAWNILGNSGTNSANFLGTIDNVSMRFRTNNIQRMIIDSTGKVGIGLNNPSYALSVLAATNPLYLSGVQATSTLSSDSILTIAAGVVKKSAYSSLNNNYWSLTGNGSTNAGTNFLGTTDNVGVHFRTNNLERMYIDSLGDVAIGTNTFDINNPEKLVINYGNTVSNTIMNVRGSINDYLQINLKNTNSGDDASTDYVATADDGTDSTNYVDFGINSSTYAPSIENWGSAHDAYLYSNSRNLLIGTQSSNSDLIFMVNGGRIARNTAMRIANPSGNVIIGSGDGTITPIGNVLRGPKAGGTNITGGSLTLQGGSSTGSASSNLNLYGGLSASGTYGAVNIIANPLTVTGVQQTTSFTTDSVLTINGTVIKKAPFSSLAGSGNWSLTGNAGTSYATNFLGTTDNVSFRLRTNNVQRVIVDSLGKVGIGTNAPSSDLTLYQSSGSGSTKGFTFTGNSIGGNNSGTGFLMSLGYNTTGNKQLWLGDADYAGVAAGSFARFVTTGTVFPVIDAVSGDNASRRYLAFGVAGDPNSGVIFGGDNTSVNPGSQVWDNGNMSIGAGYKSAAAPSNGLLVQGNVGIGTTSPLNALSVSSTNPLYLAGVQATSTFSSDSILTINAGVVKKTPYSSLPTSSGGGWSLTGNSISSGNFLGTTNAQALVLKAYNQQMGYFDGNVSSLALGVGAVNNSSDHNIAIGYNASTNNQYTLALGYNASATGVRSVAIGNGGSATTASGSEAVAIGYNANASNTQAVAMGYQAQATGLYGLALGYNPTASGAQSVAIGYQAQATQQFSNAIGYQAQATGLQSTAIGYKAQTSQSNTILLGDVSTAGLHVGIGTATPSAKLDIVATSGNNPLELTGLPTGTAGTDNILTINSSGVVGSVTAATFNGSYWSLSGNAAASGSFLGTTNTTPLQFKFNSTLAGYLDANNTALGTSSVSTSGTSNTAIGYSANAANSATAIGANSVAANVASTAIGNNAAANNSDHETAIGASASASQQYNTAVGYNAQAVNNAQATAIGTTATANGYQSTALGYGAQAISNAQTTALGATANANAQYNTAVGFGAQAISNSQATAVGYNSKTTSQYGVAMGYNAQAITNTQTTAVGSATTASGAASSAFGYDANASASQATSLGGESDATAQNNTAVGYNAKATTNAQATAIGSNTSATGSNSTVIGYGATTSQANAIVLGTSTNNVGIGTSTPNTGTKLDVAGSFKLGTNSTVLSNIIKTSVNVTVPTLAVGTTVNTTATVTGANPNATVIINPRVNLPNGVVIAYTYVNSPNTVTFGFGAGNYSGNVGTLTLDVTIIQ